MTKKKRLDEAVGILHPELSRSQIQSFIMQGMVVVNGNVASKAGVVVADDAVIVLQAQQKFVSRAGHKLEAILDHFMIDVTDLVALDAGISTGGFTDCLLQRGVKKVYGVDVGVGLVHDRVARDPRVVVIEKTNIRYGVDLPELVDCVTLDLSFISLTKVLDAVIALMKPDAQLITLIKPQFEAERHEISHGGIVKDEAVHERIIQTICTAVQDRGFTCRGFIQAPIQGAVSKNKEFVAYFIRGTVMERR